MPVKKNDGKGVYERKAAWFYRTYSDHAPESGPYKTRTQAMEALLTTLGFDVAPEPQP
jgi:hypothetical protein